MEGIHRAKRAHGAAIGSAPQYDHRSEGAEALRFAQVSACAFSLFFFLFLLV